MVSLPELALYVQELAFLVKRRDVLAQCATIKKESERCNADKNERCYALLTKLEDRNVSGLVLSRIAQALPESERSEMVLYLKGAFIRLKAEPEDQLSTEELYFMAWTLLNLRVKRKNVKEICRLLEVCVARGYEPGIHRLAQVYLNRGMRKEAIEIYEKGCSLGHRASMYELAVIMPLGSPRKKTLLIQAASLNHAMAMHICDINQWPYLPVQK